MQNFENKLGWNAYLIILSSILLEVNGQRLTFSMHSYTYGSKPQAVLRFCSFAFWLYHGLLLNKQQNNILVKVTYPTLSINKFLREFIYVNLPWENQYRRTHENYWSIATSDVFKPVLIAQFPNIRRPQPYLWLYNWWQSFSRYTIEILAVLT